MATSLMLVQVARNESVKQRWSARADFHVPNKNLQQLRGDVLSPSDLIAIDKVRTPVRKL